MKKAILFLLFISATVTTTTAQVILIPNGNFENWSSSATPPSGWVTTNSTRLTADSTIAPNTGLYALKLVTNQNGHGTALNWFSFTQRPVYFHGYFGFQRSNNPNENFRIIVALTRWDTLLGSRDTISYTSFAPVLTGSILSPWTLIQLDLNYDSLNLLDPDSATIFLTTFGGSVAFEGTTLYADDLSFSNTFAGTENYSMTAKGLKLYNYPNPVEAVTEICYTIDESGPVSVKVYDITGKEIASIINNRQAAGEHRLPFDAGSLQNGIYFYRVEAGNAVACGKMRVAH